MRYVLYAMSIIVVFGCGNQDHQSTKNIHLLDAKKPVEQSPLPTPEETTPLKEVLPVVEEENRSKIEVPLVETKLVEQVEPVDDHNVTPPFSEEALKLAELEAKMKEEIFALKIEHEQSLKKMEMEERRLKASEEKALALAKLANEKELSSKALESKQRIEMEKIQSQKESEVRKKALEESRIIKEKELALAKLQTQKEISKAQEKSLSEKLKNEKELALATLQSRAITDDKKLEFYKMIAMIITALTVLGLLILYFIVQRKRKNELKIQENELRHKEYLEASKQHNEHVKKMLEIITDEGMDKGIKKEMMRLLKDQSSQANLIEHKK